MFPQIEGLLQTDGRWVKIRLGSTTMGEEGCLIICVCNANLLLGNTISPEDLVEELVAVGGLTKNGDLIWSKLIQTSSKVWQDMGNDKSEPIQDMRLVEYESPKGSHFVLEYKEEEFDPKPGTQRGKIKSVRRLALIKR